MQRFHFQTNNSDCIGQYLPNKTKHILFFTLIVLSVHRNQMKDWEWERKVCGQETVVASHRNTAGTLAWGVNGHSKERHSLTASSGTSPIASVARLSTWLCFLVVVRALYLYWCLWPLDGLLLSIYGPYHYTPKYFYKGLSITHSLTHSYTILFWYFSLFKKWTLIWLAAAD